MPDDEPFPTQIASGSYIAQANTGSIATVNVYNITRSPDKLPTRYDGLVRSFLEYYLGTPGRPAPFGGRARDLAALDTWLKDPSAPPYAALVARAGRGKSALLAHWATRLASDVSSAVNVVYFPISVRFNTNLETIAYASLAARMAQVHGEPVTQAIDAQQYRSVFADYLRRSPADGRRVLVIIDGLDEAAGWEIGGGLFPIAPPSHLRVVVAARLLAGDADERAWLGRLDWDKPGLTTPWTLSALDKPGVADVLNQMGNPLDALVTKVDVVSRLHELSEGDPLLVRLYVEVLLPHGDPATVFTPEDLTTLVPGLHAFFQRWFEEQHKLWGDARPMQDNAVRGLLNLCATARGPLKKDDVLALAPDMIGDGLLLNETARAVNRFVIGDGTNSGYVFSHPRLGEYFSGQLSQHERKAWRDRFLKYGRETLAALHAGTLQPKEVPAYVVQYYSTHLLSANAPDEDLYALLCEDWLRAWEWLEGTPAGFLNDARRAWERAEASGPIALGKQVLAALCFASVVSVSANIDNDLLLECIQAGLVSPVLGLVVARQKPNLKDRAECLARIAAFLPSERESLLGEALSTTRAITAELSRASTIIHVVKQLPESLLGEALDVARTFVDEPSRAEALSAVVERLPEALLGEALSAARAIADESSRALVLCSVAPRLPKPEQAILLSEALNAARAAGDELGRAQALSAVAQQLPKSEQVTVLSEALSAARVVTHELNHISTLCMVAEQLPEPTKAAVIGEALSAARAILDESLRSWALCNVSKRLPEPQRADVLGEALSTMRAIVDEMNRALALQALGRQLPVSLANKALSIACAIKTEHSRAHALSAVAESLPEFLVSEALSASRTITDESSRARALSAVVEWIPESLLGEALSAARAIMSKSNRARVLSAVAQRQSGLEYSITLSEALSAARAIEDEYNRAQVFRAIAMQLPTPERATVLGEALGAAHTIADEYDRALVLSDLADHLPEPERAMVLSAALDAACVIRDESSRARVLSAVAEQLPESEQIILIGEALDAARKIVDESDRAWSLSALVEQLPESLLGEALNAARAITDESGRALAMSAFAERLSASERATVLSEALNTARMTPDKFARAQALSAVAKRLPKTEQPAVLDEALNVARSIVDEFSRIWILNALAGQLPDPKQTAVLSEALASARAVTNESNRPFALSAVVKRLSEPERTTVLGEALSAARASTKNESDRAHVLSVVAEQSPESLLGEALQMVRAVRNESASIKALAALAPRWSAMCSACHLSEFDELSATLRAFSGAQRQQLLDAIQALLPVIEQLGGTQALRETVQAILDTARWWP